MIENRKWNVVKGAYVVAGLFLVGMLFPFWMEGDLMNWGYGVALLCLMGMIAALVTAFSYTKVAKELDRVLRGLNVLARWDVSASDWASFVSVNYDAQMSRNKNLLLFTLKITAVVIAGLALLYQDTLFLPIGLGIAAIVILPALLMPRWYRRQLQQNRLVIVGENGVYCGGQFMEWQALTVQLGEVYLDDTTHPTLLVFPFSYMSGPIIESDDAFRVPVPAANRPAAEHIVAYYNQL